MRMALLSAILVLSGLLPDADPQEAQRFIGHWKLISYQQESTSGEVTEPFGKDPIGRISYDAGGHMSAQLMRNNRPKFSSSDPRRGTDAEIRGAFTEFAAYYGTYTADERAGTVAHRIEAAWFPNWIGTVQVRHYKFSGNRLILRANLPAGPSVLVWERL